MELKEQRLTRSDKDYKRAFVNFIKSRTWHWFITIPIGACDGDETVVRRLRTIEAMLCGKHLVNRYHKLPDDQRFSMIVAFEGEVKSGDRHAHILAYVPPSMKRRTSHEMMIGLFPGHFRYLWAKLKRDAANFQWKLTAQNGSICFPSRILDALLQLEKFMRSKTIVS